METTVPCLVLWFLSFCHRSRSPPDQIPFAVQSDSVRRPIRLRTVNDDLHRHIAQKKTLLRHTKVSCFRNFYVSLHLKQTNMNDNKFSVVLTEGAQAFLESLPHEAKEKIAYNIRRVMAGEMNNELFKKLENSDGIWEFRTLYRKIKEHNLE
jgi:hypothetical protein